MFLTLESIFLSGELLYNMWQKAEEGSIFAAENREVNRTSNNSNNKTLKLCLKGFLRFRFR